MNLRCAVCSAWLNIFQISSLCDVCLKISRIVKATTNIRCLNVLEENEDVQMVSSNFEVSDEILSSLTL